MPGADPSQQLSSCKEPALQSCVEDSGSSPTSIRLGKPAAQKSFSAILAAAQAEPRADPKNRGRERAASEQSSALERQLIAFSEAWQQAEQRRSTLFATVPTEMRPLLEAQLLVNRLALRLQLLSKAGESFGATLRRLQQMGGS